MHPFKNSLLLSLPLSPFLAPPRRADISRDELEMVAVVRSLPGTSHFVMGETTKSPTGVMESVALYDMHQVAATRGQGVQPLSRFVEHGDMVTSIAPLSHDATGVFLSGGCGAHIHRDSKAPGRWRRVWRNFLQCTALAAVWGVTTSPCVLHGPRCFSATQIALLGLACRVL